MKISHGIPGAKYAHRRLLQVQPPIYAVRPLTTLAIYAAEYNISLRYVQSASGFRDTRRNDLPGCIRGRDIIIDIRTVYAKRPRASKKTNACIRYRVKKNDSLARG